MQSQAGLITGARSVRRSASDDKALRLAMRNGESKVVSLVHRGTQANRNARIIQRVAADLPGSPTREVAANRRFACARAGRNLILRLWQCVPVAVGRCA